MSTRWAWVMMGAGLLFGLPAAAQVPGAPPRPMAARAMAGPPRASAAEFLLANTGELKLSDSQVSKLATIARRQQARREALRATVDSALAARRNRPDSARPRAGARAPLFAPTPLQQLREQAHADLRDALAVLTPDQLATAWERMARRPMMGRGAGFQARALGARRMPAAGMMMRPRAPRAPGMPAQPPARPQPPS